MRVLHISVLDKKATYQNRDGDIVCGNSDYVIEFAFDAEWAAHNEKIARFIWNGAYKDVTFTGTTCPVPIITGASEVEVGVYAGELRTTTPAIIGCQKSILCQSSPPGGIPFTKGEKGDPGVGEMFVVNFTTNPAACDKTTSEIIAAHLEGKTLKCIMKNVGCLSTIYDIHITDEENLIGWVEFYIIDSFGTYLEAKRYLRIFSTRNSSAGIDFCNYFCYEDPFLPTIPSDDNDGKILGRVDRTTKWISPSEIPGVDDVFVVNIIQGSSQYTCDKAVSEVIAAYLDGKLLLARFSDGKTTTQFRFETIDEENLTGNVSAVFVDSIHYLRVLLSNRDGADKVVAFLTPSPFLPPKQATDAGKILGLSDGLATQWLAPSEIPGIDNVFTVNFTGPSGDSYFTCDKTTSEIYTAHLTGKTLVGVLDNKYVSTLFYVSNDETRCIFFHTTVGVTNYRELYIYKQGEEERVGHQSSLNPFVPSAHAGSNGKILGVEGTTPKWLSPSEIPGIDNVFTVNYTSVSGGHYECEKTTSEILAAYLAGKTMIGVLDNKYVSTLFSYSVEDSENLVGYAKCYFICKIGIGPEKLTYREINVYNTGAEERINYHTYHDPFLPNRTSDVDNGKILGFVDNKTQWIDPSELGIGGANIITANSKAELPDPSTVEEGTVALVPSEGGSGGGGLPVIELTTPLSASGVGFTDSEHAALSAAADTGLPIVVKATMEYMEGGITEYLPFSAVGAYFSQGGIRIYYASLPFGTGGFIEFEGRWVFNVE